MVNKARREALEERQRNPVLVYVEKLAAVDESTLRDFLPPMGAGQDTSRLFRTPGKVRCTPFLLSLVYFSLSGTHSQLSTTGTSPALHGM